MADTNTKHWAYSLPNLPAPKDTPHWAREAVAEHNNPEYWARMWGWSVADLTFAKNAAGVPLEFYEKLTNKS